MAKLDHYRKLVQDLIKQYANLGSASLETGVERQILFDSEHDHYQLVNVGWQNERRVYSCVLHLDLKRDKVWIQHNTTDVEIAEELMALGVPKEDIVIGFHLPYKRRLTEFAVA
jgi:hypothetical protein